MGRREPHQRRTADDLGRFDDGDHQGPGAVRQAHTKTDAGRRTIIIPKFTLEALKVIRPTTAAPDMPVFPSRRLTNGTAALKPQTTHNVRRTLRHALELAGMPGDVHPHLLRSTVATFVAREQGVADAAALLGHKINAGVTGRHYIERLQLAPDTSAVLKALIEIGEAEARAEESGGWERVPSDDGEFRADESAGLNARRVASETGTTSPTSASRRGEQRREAGRADETPGTPTPPQPADAESTLTSRQTDRPSRAPSAAEPAAARWTQGELEWG